MYPWPSWRQAQHTRPLPYLWLFHIFCQAFLSVGLLLSQPYFCILSYPSCTSSLLQLDGMTWGCTLLISRGMTTASRTEIPLCVPSASQSWLSLEWRHTFHVLFLFCLGLITLVLVLSKIERLLTKGTRAFELLPIMIYIFPPGIVQNLFFNSLKTISSIESVKILLFLILPVTFRHLSTTDLLSDRQCGFRKGRFIGDLLSLLTDSWSSSLSRFGETFPVALDISKAFDRVWHKSLLAKLPSFGFYASLYSFISSFISCCSISAVVDGHCSSPKPINSGVPQGSVLSPTLFLLFNNDLSVTNHPIHSYADDSTLHFLTSFDRRPTL